MGGGGSEKEIQNKIKVRMINSGMLGWRAWEEMGRGNKQLDYLLSVVALT